MFLRSSMALLLSSGFPCKKMKNLMEHIIVPLDVMLINRD